MKKLFISILILSAISCGNPYKKIIKTLDLQDGLYAEMITSKGTIYIKLEPTLAPITTANFVGLAEGLIENNFRKLEEPDTNGSQFYITHTATPHLDGGYNVFGYVISGMEVVNEIRQGDTIEKVNIIRVGKDAKDFDAVANFKKL